MPKIRKRKKRKPGFPPEARKKIDVLTDLLGLNPGRLKIIFDTMEPAEEELASRGLTTAVAGGGSLFFALRPSEIMRELRNTAVYRAHVRELLDRYQAGEPLEPGTRIECALAILECSKTAPLNRIGLATLARAAIGSPFTIHIPDDWARFERFEGQAEAELELLRKKLTVADRCAT